MTRTHGAARLIYAASAYAAVVVILLVVGLLVASGPTSVDAAVMDAVLPERGAGLTSAASALSAVFSPVLVPVWALLVAGLLLWRDRRPERAATVLVSVAGAAAVAEALKLIVGRPRPSAADQLPAYEATLSYPSGHVTGAAALLVVLALVCTARRSGARVAAVFAALTMTGLIAWTRLYLGVHWITDVSAAVVIGSASAAIAPLLVRAALTLPTTWRLSGQRTTW